MRMNTSVKQEVLMNVLLSIKPEFAEKILAGEKRYEFRKTTFRDPSLVETVFMYASSPVKRVVGIFSISHVVEDSPTVLWDRFGDVSGVSSRDRFLQYFSGAETGYAIKVEAPTRFETPVNPRNHIEDFRPPVSFYYVNGELDITPEQEAGKSV